MAFNQAGTIILVDTPSRKNFGVDNNPFHTGRNPQGGIFYLTGLFAKYGPEQFLLRRQLGFSFGVTFPREHRRDLLQPRAG